MRHDTLSMVRCRRLHGLRMEVNTVTNPHVVITGANSGIGFQAALHFAREGAHVVMACRNLDKGQQAQRQILDAVPTASIRLIRLDVSDLASVAEFGRQLADQCGRVDVLINNAGIVAMPLSRNAAGHESQLATNYLGTFALTGTLLPLFPADAPSRIVNVGSLAHRLGKLNLDDLNWEKTPYHEWKAYANSKVAMLSFTLELDRRLRASGSRIIALAAHPGFANTNIHQNSPALQYTSPVRKWISQRMIKFVPTAADAVRPIVLAASSPAVKGGDYFGPGGFLEIGGKPARARINPRARDTEKGRQLWSLSETMTGIHYLSDL